MKNGYKIVACAVACLSLVPLARPALAANRSFTAVSAVLDTPSSAPCFAHGAGDPVLKNNCSTTQNVFLPMSMDAASWYTVSVYGRGWIAGNGSHNDIWCVADTLAHDASTMWGSSWNDLPNNGSFGGAQTITLSPIPVFSPGDASYAYCVLAPNTSLFSYGWN
jgi:hypothetical protein